jgi:predicted ATPase
LIGQNDAGKSSVLEAMYALFRSSFMPVKDVFPDIWVARELVHERSPASTVSIGAVWESPGTDKCSYDISVDFPYQDHNCVVSSETLACGDRPPLVLSQSRQTETRVASARLNPTAQNPNLDWLSPIADRLGHAHLYRFDPKTMAMPSALEVNRKFVMEVDGLGLASMLDDILGYDVELFKKIRDTFCELFPQFKSVRIQTAPALERKASNHDLQGTSITMGKGISFETRTGTIIRSFQASAGTILILGFITLAHLPEPPKILLIEEPENGIYPLRLKQVIDMIREISSRLGAAAPQIVMTTHSPYLLAFFEPEEVTLMSRRVDGSVVAQPMRDAPHIHERMGHEFNLGEIWYNVSEEDLFQNA